MKVVLVDASLYTAPYDAALTQGLVLAGVQPTWLTRPVRRGDREEIPGRYTDAFFYRRTDDIDWLPSRLRAMAKGCAHLAGTAKLIWKIRRLRPDVVHMQWIVVPVIDLAAMALIRRWCPLILTVHDTLPYNGQKMSWLQRVGHRLPARLAHHLIVHTASGRQALSRQGLPEERISVIPHGPLRLHASATPARDARDPRWTVVLFGELKPYKGLDLLIEAVAALAAPMRSQLRVVVAGRPRMDMSPLAARIEALGLGAQFDLRLRRLTEEEMAQLFAEADGFVFPYRQVDASGVYHLVKSLGKWLIASRVGIFAEDRSFHGRGALVPAQDVPALAEALRYAIAARPRARADAADASWSDIGRATRALYERARTEFAARRTLREQRVWQR
jgi:glycosyltransferase involved in cell wall biosynthesis